MGTDFPVPRALLPHVDVTPLERQARKAQMEQMLLDALDDYDRFRAVEQGRVDTVRWKHVDTKDALKLYREREAGSVSHSSLSSSGRYSSSMRSSVDDTPYEAVGAAALAAGRHNTKAVLAVGELDGRVADVVYALMASTNDEFALVQTFLHDGVADCAILHTMEGPTDETPLQYLGYKWVVKKSPGGSARLIKHRDVVYVESCGMTQTVAGETMGYLLVESVDLPSFPELTSRNCIRAVQSLSILMRQKSDTVVDVFVTGVVVPSGKRNPLGAMAASQLIFGITKAMELAESKRLTHRIVAQRATRGQVRYSTTHKPSACALCHQKRKFYNGVSLVDCTLCGEVICTRCQTHRRVFVSDGLLGQFHRTGCCKTCVRAADPTHKEPAPLKMSFSAHLKRQQMTRDVESELSDTNSMSHMATTFSPPLSSSDSSVTIDLSEHPLGSTKEGDLRGSFDNTTQPANGPGITLLSASAVRSVSSSVRTLHSNSRAARAQDDDARYPVERHELGSSPTGGVNDYASDELSLAIRPSPSSPTFTSSAPGGTYGIRDHMGSTSRTTRPSATFSTERRSVPAAQQDLFARMVELHRLAETTYQTTQQNEIIMQQNEMLQRQQRTP